MMKKSCLTILVILVVVSCKKEVTPIDFTAISGTISNTSSTTISITNRKYSKTLTLDEAGRFKDTLHLDDGIYVLKNGADNIVLELKVGYDLDITYDSNKLAETLTFSGLGAVNNNYFADRTRLQLQNDFQNHSAYFKLDKDAFNQKIAQTQKTFEALLVNAQGLDSMIVKNERRSNQQFLSYLVQMYPEKHNVLTKLPRGTTSPTFTYPDIEGKSISLNSLKGKYVYIDVWATWCGPCKVQIPYLKDLERKYEDKNITFVGLSIDTQENKGKWLTMVQQRGLGGYQLLADNDFRSKFVQEYYIAGIPRFILIDPKGNIVSPDAPRPSDPALTKLFDQLKI